MSTTAIPVATLKAALTHASKHDTRYYLRGVYVDLSVGCIVATDGHRMLVARLVDDAWAPGESYIIPRESAELAIKAAGKAPTIGVTAERNALQVGAIACEAIDGKYADWQRIVLNKASGEAAIVNPEYMLAGCKALHAIRGGKAAATVCVETHYNGTGPTVLTLAGTDALVIIMPIRAGELPNLAEYVARVLGRPIAAKAAA